MQEMIKEFCRQRDWDQFHNPKDLAIGISTEANELLDIFRFKSADQMDDLVSSGSGYIKISDELADVFFFVLRFAEKYNIDLEEALKEKMRKNSEKYPVEKSKGSNRKYTEF